MCVASHNNHPTSLASSWDISFLKSLVQQDPKGSNKVANLFILDVYVSPNGKYVYLSLIYYILDFSLSCPKMTLISIFTRMTPSRKVIMARSITFEQRNIKDWSSWHNWSIIFVLQLCCLNEDLTTNMLAPDQ